MKFTFIINQAGVVRCGLLGKVQIPALCLLDYLIGWFSCGKAKFASVDGRLYVWVRYEHAVEEMPLLFNPQAAVETRKNQLSRLVQDLRKAGLVDSVRVGQDLYLRPTDLATALASSRERTATKSTPAITPSRDNTVTPLHDDPITQIRDDNAPLHIDETTIKETNTNETLPHSLPMGEHVWESTVSSVCIEEQIFNAYPKRVGKPSALRAIRRALKAHTPEFLLERTARFAESYTGEPRFIPHPAKWFSEERFNDDPSTWRGNSSTTRKHQPKLIRPENFNNQSGKL